MAGSNPFGGRDLANEISAGESTQSSLDFIPESQTQSQLTEPMEWGRTSKFFATGGNGSADSESELDDQDKDKDKGKDQDKDKDKEKSKEPRVAFLKEPTGKVTPKSSKAEKRNREPGSNEKEPKKTREGDEGGNTLDRINTPIGNYSKLQRTLQHIEDIDKALEKKRVANEVRVNLASLVKAAKEEATDLLEAAEKERMDTTGILLKEIRELRKVVNNLAHELQETKDKISQIETGNPATPSFSAMLKVPKKMNIQTNIAQKPPALLVKHPDKTSDETKKIIQDTINPTEEGYQVVGLRKTRNTGVVISTKDENSKMTEMKEKLEKKGLVVTLPGLKRPRIIIYGVDSDMDEENLLKAIHAQNYEKEGRTLEEVKANFKPIFKTGRKNMPTRNWVLETSPAARKNAVQQKGKMQIGWYSCRVEDYVEVTRCYKCQGTNHTAAKCKEQNETCSHCGQIGHSHKVCSKKNEPPKCVNCAKLGLKADHPAVDRSCAFYLKQVELRANHTDYGY